MRLKNVIPSFMLLLSLISCKQEKKTFAEEVEKSPDLKIEFEKVSPVSVFRNDTLSIWGGSLIKGEDGLYHMFYSRWPKRFGWAWVTDSEIAHAVSESPFGPFTFKDVALKRTDKDSWDGWCTHNPTVHKFNGKYYLYYMGNTGDGEITSLLGKEKLNMNHRNNQRIGVAVADSPSGPWKRFSKPVLDISDNEDGYDALMTSNPSVCQMPDGKILMVYKAVGKKNPMPFGGPVVHMVAISDSPTGPFKKYPDPVFTFEGERFPAEDPYIWYQDGKFRAIVKRIEHKDKERVFSLVHYDSEDGIKWDMAKNFKISKRIVEWENGRKQQLLHLERPQVYIENGEPIALLCAADTLNAAGERDTFNVQIPLKISKE